MTTAIARPASNEIVTINIVLLTFVPATPFSAARQIVNPPNLLVLPVTTRSSVRVASEEEVFQERSGKPIGGGYRPTVLFPSRGVRFFMRGSRRRGRCRPASGMRTSHPVVR